MPIRSIPEDQAQHSAAVQSRGRGKLLSHNVIQGIQSSASDVSTGPFLVAHTPAPAPFARQHCSLIFLPSCPRTMPAEVSLFGNAQVSLMGPRDTQRTVPALPSLCSCCTAQPREGEGMGHGTSTASPAPGRDSPTACVALGHGSGFIS